MEMSQEIAEFAKAMSAAQLEMTGAKRDSDNPFFKSKYADLASVREACLGAMNRHGLCVVQFPRMVSGGESAWIVEVETVITHTSGQFMKDTLAVPVSKPDAQGVGSAISYARRYALGAVAGVAPEDDDGNAAVGNDNGHADTALPNGAMETAIVRVEKVTMKPTANGKTTQYTVHANDGRTYTTIKRTDAETAKLACEAGQSVEIAYVPTRWGRDIKSIAEVQVAEPAL